MDSQIAPLLIEFPSGKPVLLCTASAHAQNGICRISIRATVPDPNLRMLRMKYVELTLEKQSHSLTAHAREISIRATVPDLNLRMLRMECT
jgi:hypothetical protein